jgi:hypothetical protein
MKITRYTVKGDKVFLRAETDDGKFSLERTVGGQANLREVAAEMFIRLEDVLADYTPPPQPIERTPRERTDLRDSVTEKDKEDARKREEESRQRDEPIEPTEPEEPIERTR